MQTITLKWPILIDGKEISQLTMRRAKVRDLKEAQRFADDQVGREVALIAILCGLLPEQLEDMDLAIFNQLRERFSDLLEKRGPMESHAHTGAGFPVSAERDRCDGAGRLHEVDRRSHQLVASTQIDQTSAPSMAIGAASTQ